MGFKGSILWLNEKSTARAQMIDHAWGVALDRAQKAGQLLAAALMAGGHGDRPVTLVGYSMGARLIFHALLELCRRGAKGARMPARMLRTPHERLWNRVPPCAALCLAGWVFLSTHACMRAKPGHPVEPVEEEIQRNGTVFSACKPRCAWPDQAWWSTWC
jgi:pimeloyl-ACP methyl ester carboxylesterase